MIIINVNIIEKIMRRDFTKDFAEIQEFTNKIRSLNESISFADSYCTEDDEFMGQNPDFGQEMDDCADGECNLSKVKFDDDKSDEQKAVETKGGANAVNQIREIALKGMVALCANPEDPVYQTLKKIFTFCDKAVTEKSEDDVK